MSKVDDIQYNIIDIMANRIIEKLKNISDYIFYSKQCMHSYEYSIFFTKANEFG